MQRSTNRSEAFDMASPRSSRAASVSSDRISLSSSRANVPNFSMNTRPAPAYVAVAAASQMVTDHQYARLRDEYGFDASLPDEDFALFSESALDLVNAFLDYLLYSFLAQARSPSLSAIRPAVLDILKTKLAREAMAAADEELEGLLAGGEDEEEIAAQHNSKFDLESVWKRTRLRIMVYIRLGEMEDEDEERYLEQEELLNYQDGSDEPENAGLVSWTAAIFLTSVLEYIAEQTLLAAGQSAYQRVAGRKNSKGEISPTSPMSADGFERVIVQDFDVEKIALNSTLGRLWRTWRKFIRSPAAPLSPSSGSLRRMSSFGMSPRNSHHRRQNSNPVEEVSVPEIPEREPTETEIASNIPLPMNPNDIEEIEAVGTEYMFDADDESETPRPRGQGRPTSVIYKKPKTMLGEAMANLTRRDRPVSMPIAPPAYFPPEPAHQSAEPSSSEGFVTPTEGRAGTQAEARDEDPVMSAEARPPSMQVPTLTVASRSGLQRDYMSPDAEEEYSPVSPLDPEEEALPASYHSGRVSMIDTPVREQPPEVPSFPPTSLSANAAAIREEIAAKEEMERAMREKESKREQLQPPQGVGDEVQQVQTPKASATPETRTPETVKEQVEPVKPATPDQIRHAIGVARTMDVPVPSPESQKSRPSTKNSDEIPKSESRTSSRRAPVPPPPAPRSVPPGTEQQVEKSFFSPGGGPTMAELEQDYIPAPLTVATSRSKPYTGTSVTNIRVNGSPSTPERNERNRSLDTVHEKPTPRKSSEHSSARKPLPPAIEPPITRQRTSSTNSRGKPTSSHSKVHSSKSSESGFVRVSSDSGDRDFDMLLQGNKTVKYTLTSQNMRDIENSNSATLSAPPEIPREPSPQSYARAMAQMEQESARNRQATRKASLERNLPPRPATNNSASRKNGLAAREPRIQTESLRDMADFIRSTGPTGRGDAPLPLAPSSTAVANRIATSPQQVRSQSAGLVSKDDSNVGRRTSIRRKLNLEPRDPSANQRSGTSDLVDFLREGPPSAPGASISRTNRAAAPYADDNQASMLGSSTAASSKASMNTVNSRTGLLSNGAQNGYGDNSSGNSPVVQPHFGGPGRLMPSASADDFSSGGMPPRTRRRVKDPYAIDDSDDDDDLLTALPGGPPKRQEESLIDFLNSVDPPPSSGPKPLDLQGRGAAGNTKPHPHKISVAAGGMNPLGSHPASPRQTAPPRPKPGQSPLTPTGMSAGSMGVPPRKMAKPIARDTDNTSTSELADFLRNSGPPEPPPGAGHRRDRSMTDGEGKKRRWNGFRAMLDQRS